MSPHPVIIDRGLLRRRQRRALAGDTPTFLIERVADDLNERLAAVLRHFEVAADLGTPTPHLKNVLVQSGKVEAIIAANALLAYGLDFRTPMVRNVQQLAVAADE